MTSNNVVEIGGRRYVIDPKGHGELLKPKHLGEQLAAQKPNEADTIPGQVAAYSYEWTRDQERSRNSSHVACFNFPCPKSPKLGRKYCSNYCMNRANGKRRYRRERGLTRWLDLAGGAAVHFHRPFPRSLRRAKNLFIEHISDGVCQFRGEDESCPSTKNTYNDPGLPRCLLYAVYADDLMIWQARNSGQPTRRRYTTEDGRWQKVAYGRSKLTDNDMAESTPLSS